MRALAQSLAPAEEELGATMAGLAALVAQRYLRRYHLDDRAFDPVSVLDRAASARNPQAQFRTPVSLAEVARSRPVALPLRLFHCSAITDGAAAVVLEKGSGGVQVLGFGQGMDNQPLVDRAELTTFRATRSAAQRAYEMAKMTRKELSFAELHDAFAPFGLIDLEDIGICGPGGAAGWFSKEWTGVNGRFPVNPSGGLLGRGHPVGATGLVQIAEIARQLGDDAGPLQLPGRPSVGLAQSIGGMGCHNFVTILGRGRDP
jgi:acetyl-CoA C-acetyltransferase